MMIKKSLYSSIFVGINAFTRNGLPASPVNLLDATGMPLIFTVTVDVDGTSSSEKYIIRSSLEPALRIQLHGRLRLKEALVEKAPLVTVSG